MVYMISAWGGNGLRKMGGSAGGRDGPLHEQADHHGGEEITKLLDLARWVREAQKHGQELGLTGKQTRCARVSRPRTWV
jgi:hypothetical protein